MLVLRCVLPWKHLEHEGLQQGELSVPGTATTVYPVPGTATALQSSRASLSGERHARHPMANTQSRVPGDCSGVPLPYAVAVPARATVPVL